MGKFLFAHNFCLPADRVKMPRFLNDQPTVLINLNLSAGFVFNGLHNKFDTVDIFHFAAGTQLVRPLRPYRHINVAAHGTLIHIAVAGADIAQNRTQLLQKSPCFRRRAKIRLGHDFH